MFPMCELFSLFGGQIDEWIGHRPKVVVMNREDMVTGADRLAWAQYYGQQAVSFCFTDGKRGAVSAPMPTLPVLVSRYSDNQGAVTIKVQYSASVLQCFTATMCFIYM